MCIYTKLFKCCRKSLYKGFGFFCVLGRAGGKFRSFSQDMFLSTCWYRMGLCLPGYICLVNEASKSDTVAAECVAELNCLYFTFSCVWPLCKINCPVRTMHALLRCIDNHQPNNPEDNGFPERFACTLPCLGMVEGMLRGCRRECLAQNAAFVLFQSGK